MANYRKRNPSRGYRDSSYTDRRQDYVYGNAVRRLGVEPQRRETAAPVPPRRVSRQVRKNRSRAMRISAGYVAFLAIAAVMGLVVCVQFLQLRSQVTVRSKNITAMQQELVTLKDENNTKYNNIMDSVSLEEVRERAINELGMIYAKPGQVIEYQNPENDYVKQYENIPENGVLAISGKVSD